jgi:hypothetical protein
MKEKPTNTKTYTGYPQWPFLGGPGYLIAIKFSDSPIGAYNEIFFIPGMYKPRCSFKPWFSVQRIWVDSMASRHAGRSIWGIPKVRYQQQQRQPAGRHTTVAVCHAC